RPQARRHRGLRAGAPRRGGRMGRMDGFPDMVPVWPALVAAPVFLLGSFGLGYLVAWVGVGVALRSFRGSTGAPWTERARLAFPARELVANLRLIVPLAIGAVVVLGVAPAGGWSFVSWGVAAGFAGMLGVTAVGNRLERRLLADGPGGGAPPRGVGLRH